MNDKFNNLDDEWIKSFEKNEKLYQDFYKDDVYYINVKIIYTNKINEVVKIKNDPFILLNKNCISQEEIIKILKHHFIDETKRYSLLSILRYNITLEPNDIKHFLINKNGENNSDYLTIIKNIDDIPFKKSIKMFQDLNEIIFVLNETSYTSNNLTKKIIINTHTNTRQHKKTIKNTNTQPYHVKTRTNDNK